ncbi:MAG: hypothetical protein WCT32_03240 [Patescibacteria group bacterium]
MTPAAYSPLAFFFVLSLTIAQKGKILYSITARQRDGGIPMKQRLIITLVVTAMSAALAGPIPPDLRCETVKGSREDLREEKIRSYQPSTFFEKALVTVTKEALPQFESGLDPNGKSFQYTDINSMQVFAWVPLIRGLTTHIWLRDANGHYIAYRRRKFETSKFYMHHEKIAGRMTPVISYEWRSLAPPKDVFIFEHEESVLLPKMDRGEVLVKIEWKGKSATKTFPIKFSPR